MSFLRDIGRWIGFCIAMAFGLLAMVIVWAASVSQAIGKFILQLTED